MKSNSCVVRRLEKNIVFIQKEKHWLMFVFVLSDFEMETKALVLKFEYTLISV